jgi:gamma-glutamylcyclotransferase (GGCT)/AIG2-like uncharacterized protein YtfP
MSSIKNYVFVYGSLRKNMVNHHVLDSIDASYIGDYKTVNDYFMVGLKSKAYPYVLEEHISDDLRKGSIYGEVYSVSDKGLLYLDGLEGHPHNYIREKVELTSEQGSLFGYIYILKNKEMIHSIKENFGKRFVSVPGNDWKKHLNL